MAEEGKGFQGLKAWQKAYDLALHIYMLTKNFPKEETYGLMAQLQRAVVSVSANIAEGYERQHRKEYLQFLCIAKGSLGETETYLLLARDLGYMTQIEYTIADEKRKETSKLLRGLIKSLT
jgi:four helix bundle protein